MTEAGGFKNKVLGLILFTLFAWLMISVAVSFGTEYGADTTQFTGGALDLDEFETGIENVSSDAEEQRVRFESGDIEDVDTVTGIFSTLKSIVGFATTPFRLLSQILNSTFHLPTEAISVFLGLLALSIIFAIWRAIRTGD
jgi:hypothetical protein